MAFVTSQYIRGVMNYQNDDHKSASYDRQSCAYKCGRASKWQKPCWQGPDAKGSCGGVSECAPLRRGDRYHCQRPERAGGACKEGPLPSGLCCHTRVPCRPVFSLRKFRGRLTLIGLLVIIGLITIFSNREPSSGLMGMINPGELSSAHSGFPSGDQCVNCHEPHDKDLGGWIMGAVEHHDLTAKCIQCHELNGPAKLAHNRVFENSDDSQQVECKACHKEHKGSNFDIKQVSNETCSTCHQKQFSSFDEHAEFSPTFPHLEPQNIFFDHSTHLGEYFVEDKWLEKENRDAELGKKAATTCSTCHAIETAERDVPIRDFEKVCAGCHEAQISEKTLTLLTPDEASPAIMGLLSLDEEDADSYEVALDLMNVMADEGMDGLMTVIEEAGTPKSTQRNLLKGLDQIALQETMEAWIAFEVLDVDSEANNQLTGWKSGINGDGADAIMYQTEGHADAVLRLWIELYLGKVSEDQSEFDSETLESLMDSSQGPGACGKCHGTLVGAAMRNEKLFNWGKTKPTVRVHTDSFSHQPHLDLLGETEGCESCHIAKKEGDFPAYFEGNGMDLDSYQSSYEGIKLETCTTCHNEKRVSDDCQLCHSYHPEVGLQLKLQKPENEGMQQ